MQTSKPLWLDDPDPNQTSVRFCCPHCFGWVRNNEFEEHLKLAHPDIAKQSSDSEKPEKS